MPTWLIEYTRFWWRDLALSLTTGAARMPAVSADGARWLASTTLIFLSIGLLLYGGAGYHAGFHTLNEWARAYPAGWWQGLTLLGDERVVFALALLFARRKPRVFWSLVCAAVLATLYARGLKPLLDLPRPPAVLDPGSFQLIGPAHRRESFPSGHSVTAGVFFSVLIYHARWIEWRVLFLLLAVLAGLSRVALGVHWPIDVVAGLAGGGIAAGWGIALARRYDGGLTNAEIHFGCVVLATFPTLALLLTDGGYPEVAAAQRALSVLALLALGVDYGLLPLWRWRRAHRP